MTCHCKGHTTRATLQRKIGNKQLVSVSADPSVLSLSLSQFMSRLLWHVLSVARFCKLTNIQVYITQAPPECPQIRK